jgi:hypothetical protein
VTNAFDLIGRELAFLVIITMLGSGPATLLKGKVSAPVRFAIMPVIGVCAGSCVFTTLLEQFPASSTFWLLPVLAVASVTAAVLVPRRYRARRPELQRDEKPASTSKGPREYVKLLLVAIIVASPFSLALLHADSVGPTTYQVYDMADYIAFQDGAQHLSFRQAIADHGSSKNYVQSLYSGLTGAAQEAEISPLAANVNELLGRHATDTISAFLIGLLVAGGLGIFAAISIALGVTSWWAVFGGCLIGGSFFMQLFFDGSEGAISGLVVLVPLGVLGVIAARGRRLRYLVPFSICLAGLIDFYPILIEVVAVAGGAFVAVAGIRSLRSRDWRGLVGGGPRLLVVLILTYVFDIVGFGRAYSIWLHSLRTDFASVGFPQYHLFVDFLPGWILQTVGFYSFATGPTPHVSAIALWLVPAAIVVGVVVALRRNLFAGIALAGMGTCVLAAIYQLLHSHCSYCEDRSLLPLAIISMFLVGLGLASLARAGGRWTSGAALAIFVLAAGSMAYSGYNEFVRFTGGSFFLQAPVRQVLNHLPSNSDSVDVEGFGAGNEAAGELPIVYDLVEEKTNGRVSLAADQPSFGLAYFGLSPLTSPVFNPSYQYVLTRVPGIATNRRVVARAAGVALEKRTDALDVLIDAGIGVPTLPSENPLGSATVLGPLDFVVTGQTSTNPSVTITIDFGSEARASNLAKLLHTGTSVGSTLKFCAEASGSSVIHTVTFSNPALDGAQLTSMRASTSPCPST